MAVARVAARVEQGGHSIPEPVIRRFETGLRNFHEVYKPLVDAWTLYDNSDTFPVNIGTAVSTEANSASKATANS